MEREIKFGPSDREPTSQEVIAKANEILREVRDSLPNEQLLGLEIVKLRARLAEADQALAWCYHIAAPFGAKWKADEEYAHALEAVERHKARQAAKPSPATED